MLREDRVSLADLAERWRALSRNWADVRSRWNDSGSRHFEETYWRAIASEMERLLSRAEAISESMRRLWFDLEASK